MALLKLTYMFPISVLFEVLEPRECAGAAFKFTNEFFAFQRQI